MHSAESTVQIDNDTVRVTEWRFGPGAATGYHRHAYDYVVVPMTTGRLRLDEPGGQRVAELKAGVVLLAPGRRRARCHQCQRLPVRIHRDRDQTLSAGQMPVIAVFNHKGGVGKTTTTLNLGAALAARGKDPLLIDLDPQSSLTLALGLRQIAPTSSLFAFFKAQRPLGELIRPLPTGRRVVPSSIDLSKIEALHGSGCRRFHAGSNKVSKASSHPATA